MCLLLAFVLLYDLLKVKLQIIYRYPDIFLVEFAGNSYIH